LFHKNKINGKMPPKNNTVLSSPVRKKISEVKAKYSSIRRVSNKQNNVFAKEYHYGLMSLQLKKSTNKEEDAYFKDFLDNLDNDSSIAEKLGIIKVTFERESANFNNAKTQLSEYKSRQILGIAPQEKENDSDYRKDWADKIIEYLNNGIKWKYENLFRFRADLTRNRNGKIDSSLDEALLNEDIGGFVGLYLFDEVNEIKDNKEIMGFIFGNKGNLDQGESLLLENSNSWKEDK
jgi:hypothetical protein